METYGVTIFTEKDGCGWVGCWKCDHGRLNVKEVSHIIRHVEYDAFTDGVTLAKNYAARYGIRFMTDGYVL